MRLTYGVGFNDRKYKTTIDGRPTREYSLWMSMLYRCYNEESHKLFPTYTGCTVHEFFHSYSNFYEWCQDQIGFDCGFELDKDLLVKGNKIYSKDLCLFLPRKLNGVLTKSNAARGDLPIGVSFNKQVGRYMAQIKMFKKCYGLGYFDNPIDAFNAYKAAREEHVKNVANIYKDQIDPRAYDALMNYRVEITD